MSIDKIKWIDEENFSKEYPKMTIGQFALECYEVACSAKGGKSPWTVDMFAQTFLTPSSKWQLAFLNEHLIAFIVAQTVIDECDIYFVAVKKSYQGKGLASQLLKDFISRMISGSVTHFFLEVRVSNAAAIALYQKMGFQTITTVKNYYQNPKEDAYRMHLTNQKDLDEEGGFIDEYFSN